jgi:hypothetical protein
MIKPANQTTHQPVPPQLHQTWQTSQDRALRAHQKVELTLRVVHHWHTARVARLAYFLHLLSKNLLNVHKQMHKEAVAMAGKCYINNH